MGEAPKGEPTRGRSARCYSSLDTTVLIDYLRDAPAAARVEELIDRGDIASTDRHQRRGISESRPSTGTELDPGPDPTAPRYPSPGAGGVAGGVVAPELRCARQHAIASGLPDRRGRAYSRRHARDRHPEGFPDARDKGRALAGGPVGTTSCGLATHPKRRPGDDSRLLSVS